ncbi:MAG: ATP synthase F0 subunit B, partial [Oscillospiraceae bacterium]|nr:ATP synthase F0 subunit B [Oscillospiraceae bacterium]
MDLYQSLVTVNPVTLIAQICNLFLQLLIVKIFFLDKIKAILDQRREAADREITDAEAAKAEALAIKATYEQNMQDARAKADDILMNAQRS